MNWANSSLICQPCMGREVNTRFKYLPNTRTNTGSIPFLILGKNQPLSLILGPEETGMKALKKYPMPILATYERNLKNPRIPGLVLYRYSKVDTHMTRVHSPSPMWKRTHEFNLFSFQIACFFPGFVKLLGFSFLLSPLQFQSQTFPKPFHVQWWAPFLVHICTVKKYNVYCKEIVKEIHQKKKHKDSFKRNNERWLSYYNV